MKYFTKQRYQDNQKVSWSSHINKKAKELAEENEKQNQKAIDDYWEHYKQIEQHLSNGIKKIHTNQNMNMHDCRITGSGFTGNDFYMNVDSNGGFCAVNKITFTNARILESDIDLDGAWWLYDEVYIQQKHYEMHILFHSKRCELGEAIITFNDIHIEGR